MLSPGDDYPLHQTPRPVRDPGTDRNLYDRFFFNLWSPDLSTYVAVAQGQYPGRNVIDGAMGLSVEAAEGRVQHNIRASRALGEDRLDTRVGPLAIEVLEPLHRLRVTLGDNDAGLGADLTFTSRCAPFEEDRYIWRNGRRVIGDYTRLTQAGTWDGSVTTPDTGTIDVRGWLGGRDRSWGIRPVGEPDPMGAPEVERPGFYWLWAPLHVGDRVYLFDVNETPEGTRWHEGAMACPVGGAFGDITKGKAAYTSAYQPGTRHFREFSLDLDLPDGRRRLDFDLRYPFVMAGIGYTHPTMGHGTWQGPSKVEHDRWVLADVNPTAYMHQHVQHIATITADDGTSGSGVLEQLIIGAHDPTGLTSLLDMWEG
jgi:hypothetical protein